MGCSPRGRKVSDMTECLSSYSGIYKNDIDDLTCKAEIERS